MPIHEYKCNECKTVQEFISGITCKELHVPEDGTCPICKKGKLEKQFNLGKQGYNINGYCYENEYGRKAIHKKSSKEHAEIILGENPY